MPDTLLRQWAMLRLIPRAPRRIDTAELEARLKAQGFSVTRRTLQRDLIALSTFLPLVCDGRRPCYGWSWMKQGPVMDLPGMDPQTALTFRLVDRFLAPLLPRTTLGFLKPYLDRAGEVLAQVPDTGLKGWAERVRVIGRGQALIAPAIAPEVLDSVYAALLSGKRFMARYRPRGAGGTSSTM